MLSYPNIELNARCTDGMTALMWACRYGNKDIVQLLLSYPSIEFNARDNGGWTVLMFACFTGHTNVVKMLLSDSNIEVRDTNGLPQEMRDFIELRQEASKELKRFNVI